MKMQMFGVVVVNHAKGELVGRSGFKITFDNFSQFLFLLFKAQVGLAFNTEYLMVQEHAVFSGSQVLGVLFKLSL
jgi:hypothetical protein